MGRVEPEIKFARRATMIAYGRDSEQRKNSAAEADGASSGPTAGPLLSGSGRTECDSGARADRGDVAAGRRTALRSRPAGITFAVTSASNGPFGAASVATEADQRRRSRDRHRPVPIVAITEIERDDTPAATIGTEAIVVQHASPRQRIHPIGRKGDRVRRGSRSARAERIRQRLAPTPPQKW